MKELTAIEWPTMGVKHITESVEFYVKKLNFEVIRERIISDKCREVELKLFDFYLLLRENETNGPIYEKDKKIRKLIEIKIGFSKAFFIIHLPMCNYKFFSKFVINISSILYVPIPEPEKYFTLIRDKGVKMFLENKFVGYDLEGFYILDYENNKIFFFRDHHGLYNPHSWKWILQKSSGAFP